MKDLTTLNVDQKVQSFKDLKFKVNQKIVCSDEGNLPDFYKPDQKRIYTPKPQGVWYAYGSQWINYLTDVKDADDDFITWGKKRIASFNWIYQIKISDSVYVLKEKDFPKFEKKWANADRDGINWYSFSKQYSGIDIEWNRRMNPVNMKYYSAWAWRWDVSSGCVWNHDGFKSVKLIREYVPQWTLK